MMTSIDHYDDIQKVESFTIIINSNSSTKQPQNEQGQPLETKQILRDEQTTLNRARSRRMMQGSCINPSSSSIADLALRKIQYRTRLHQNVQRYAAMKEKCEQLMIHSPYRDRQLSLGQDKRTSVHKSQLKMLNYHRKKNISYIDNKTCELASPKAKVPINFPQLTINPFLLNIRTLHFQQSFSLLRTVKEKPNHSIYLAQSVKSKTIYTLKIIKKCLITPVQLTELIKELKMQSYLNHSNIIRIYYITSDAKFLYVFYEPAKTTTLTNLLKDSGVLFEREARRIIKQICLAVQHLQKNHIIHHNICPQSIFYQEGIAKLGSFSQAQYINQTKLFGKCKSQGILSQTSRIFELDGKTDIWNIGVLTYELLYGRIPIQLQQDLNKKTKVAQSNQPKDSLYFCEEIDVSNTAKEFISTCLERNHAKRKGIREIMEHGFLKGGEKYRWTTA